MIRVQITLAEELVAEVDRVAKKIGTTRSEFSRRALQQAIARLREKNAMVTTMSTGSLMTGTR